MASERPFVNVIADDNKSGLESVRRTTKAKTTLKAGFRLLIKLKQKTTNYILHQLRSLIISVI